MISYITAPDGLSISSVPARKTVVEISGLNKWYGNFQVLHGIDLKVRQGERIVLCGPSGSGKSTLIRCIGRLEIAEKGLSGPWMSTSENLLLPGIKRCARLAWCSSTSIFFRI